MKTINHTVVFFGTPYYVLPILEKVNKYFRIQTHEKGLLAVVTQPPRPSGRGNKLEYSAVDTWAFKNNIKIIHNLGDVPEADIAIVASYGKIIPQTIIDRFPLGVLNIHPSLLPKYRGTSPVQEALKNGDTETGLAIIKMDSKMDHGPIVSSFKESILEDDNYEVLRDRLFEKSADFLIELLPSYLSNKIKLKEQDHENATFTSIITKEDGFIELLSLGKEARKVVQLIKAYTPWPGVWTIVNIKGEDKRLKIVNAHLENEKLIIDEVQLEGKNIVNWKQFSNTYPQIAKAIF